MQDRKYHSCPSLPELELSFLQIVQRELFIYAHPIDERNCASHLQLLLRGRMFIVLGAGEYCYTFLGLSACQTDKIASSPI